MKTTIIELLNKIANGEEPPKKILFKNNIYAYTEEGYFDEENKDLLFDAYYTDGILNDEVEILETTITIDGKTINLEELKSSFNCPVGEKGESVFDKIEKLIVPNPREWLNNATLLDVKIEIRGIEMKLNEIIDRLNKEEENERNDIRDDSR